MWRRALSLSLHRSLPGWAAGLLGRPVPSVSSPPRCMKWKFWQGRSSAWPLPSAQYQVSIASRNCKVAPQTGQQSAWLRWRGRLGGGSPCQRSRRKGSCRRACLLAWRSCWWPVSSRCRAGTPRARPRTPDASELQPRRAACTPRRAWEGIERTRAVLWTFLSRNTRPIILFSAPNKTWVQY